MNRLTHWNGKKYILPQGAWREIAERLAAYENTGLEPEEIEALKPKKEAKQMSKLHLNVCEEMSLSEIVAGIRNGKVKLSVGDAVTTCLKSGKEIDFVVTDIDDKAYRFESRDCLGRHVPATKLEGFLTDVWNDLPDEIREIVIETERRRSVKGEIKTEVKKLFLPAASEIFPPESCYGDKGLYEQMDWYKKVQNRVRAFEKDGDADWYWTQSSYSGNSAYWCNVYYNGYASGYAASYTNIAAPVCFRISRF